MNRNDINLAEYNPRVCDDDNKKRLEKGLKKHGLLEPLIYNKRTGNLVSGHQRISILDKLERGTDYEIEMSVIDVSEKEEKVINVQLNNKSMQGEFDFELLGDMVLDAGVTFDDLGFTDFDVNMMYGDDDRFADMFADTPGVEAAKSDISDIKEQRKQMNDKYSEQQNADFYFVVVCENQAQKDKLLKQMSVPLYEKYVLAKHLARLKNKDVVV